MLAQRLSRRFTMTQGNVPVARKLREVVKLSLFEKENVDTIKDIWTKFHQPKKHLVARSFSKEEYSVFGPKMKECPMFIYPVKRDSGHFTLVGQAQENVILFAHLDDFKKNSILTNPIMVLVFFEELLKTKGVVLARADITDGSLKREEANRIFSQVLMFYGTGELFERFVIPFNREPSQFNYAEYSRLMDLSMF